MSMPSNKLEDLKFTILVQPTGLFVVIRELNIEERLLFKTERTVWAKQTMRPGTIGEIIQGFIFELKKAKE